MDYCTLWLEGFWSSCCKAHDLAYEVGVPRADADADLATCVALIAETPGGAWIAVTAAGLMFVGTRLFGWKFYKPKRKEIKE